METVQVGLRLPVNKNNELEIKAKEIGISKNALIQILIDIGLKTYKEFTIQS